MKALVVLSGGMDSTAALARAYRIFNGEVGAVSFDYGQRHKRELVCAEAIARHYSIRHRVIRLADLAEVLEGKSALTTLGPDVVPHGHYEEESMRVTVVPYRNTVMFGIAASVAEAYGCNELWVGVHAGDHAIYPDCRAEYITQLQETLRLGSWHPVMLYAPWLANTKAEIAEFGVRDGAPFQLTWTCYEGGNLHCGKCATCVERLEAFADAGVKDPVEYEDSESWKQVVGHE